MGPLNLDVFFPPVLLPHRKDTTLIFPHMSGIASNNPAASSSTSRRFHYTAPGADAGDPRRAVTDYLAATPHRCTGAEPRVRKCQRRRRPWTLPGLARITGRCSVWLSARTAPPTNPPSHTACSDMLDSQSLQTHTYRADSLLHRCVPPEPRATSVFMEWLDSVLQLFKSKNLGRGSRQWMLLPVRSETLWQRPTVCCFFFFCPKVANELLNLFFTKYNPCFGRV